MSQVLEFERVDREQDAPARPSHLGLAVTVIVTGLISVFGSAALEPAPHHEQTSWLWIAEIGSVAFFALAGIGAYAALNQRSVLGFRCLMAASIVQLGLVIGCPVSGHHRYGAWWAGQMALAIAFVAVSSVAYGISRSRPAPRPAGE